MKIKMWSLLFILFTTILTSRLFAAAGKVYLVLGSDTAIWDGMSTNRFHCTYNIDLYTNPARNAYGVMNPAFRARFVDSYGQPLKMTWWMMAGNIFRYATNNNVPLPNIMTMYLMKKYHGDHVQQIGDELSLHYHTFAWTDYNGDGLYYWNQSLTFLECLDDFNVTLAQFLLEEHVFPVSFRSGWHYMDNDWQHYLDELLPYSMHNDWPNKRIDLTEPMDNTYDWSLAPEEFIPYHPSPENYQIPGYGPGWNVRSTHFNTAQYRDLMDYIFKKANEGKDQVACLWGHLPETDFLQNIEILDSLAHKMAAKYPAVKFHYCTAIEAMQRWLGTSDQTPPLLTVSEVAVGDKVSIRVQTDEPIFQPRPFVAVKTIYEQYLVLPCQAIGTNEWQTTVAIPKPQLAKIGVAVCDSVGNQSLEFIQFLPDDIYLDNKDPEYAEINGSWSTSAQSAWELDSRIATLSSNDSAKVRWSPGIPQSGYYNIFFQIPPVTNHASHIKFKFIDDGKSVDTLSIHHALLQKEWIYLKTVYFTAGGEDGLEMMASGVLQPGKTLAADVVKFSALVRERDLYITYPFLQLGEVSIDDSLSFPIEITNCGLQDLTVTGISSTRNTIFTSQQLPLIVSGMSRVNLLMQFHYPVIGLITDTLFIHSNDPVEPQYPIVVNANVQTAFAIIDNEHTQNYTEYGNWAYSVAQAYGASSRYAYLNQKPRAYATFTTTLKRSGKYELFEIVPTTENATNYALYLISISNTFIDSVVVDQNKGSGAWVSLGQYNIPAAQPIEIKVMDTGKNSYSKGVVLRADAIKFVWLEDFSDVHHVASLYPNQLHLEQNYPNPFNPTTAIKYYLPQPAHVQLTIYNFLGQEVTRLVDNIQSAGVSLVVWDGRDKFQQQTSSGVYFYTLQTGTEKLTRKMLLVR